MNAQRLYDALNDKLSAWLKGAVVTLPNFALAVVVLVVAWALSKVAYKLTARASRRVGANRAARELIATFVRLAVLLAGVVMALGVLQLDKMVASVLAGAGIAGLALGFAFQDLAANVISGIGLAMNHHLPFQIGDLIETNGVLGTVREVHLRTTILDEPDGQVVILPNKLVYQDKVTNYTLAGMRRVDVKCGVSYGDDLREVQRVAKDALAGVPGRVADKEVEVFFESFGDSSIDFVGRVWVGFKGQRDYMAAISEAVVRLKAAFDAHDISIPFPIRTLDFGIRGGERLGETLAATPVRVAVGTDPRPAGDAPAGDA